MQTIAITLAALALTSLAGAQPLVRSDPLPRSLTPEEAAWIKRHPIVAEQTRAAPPGPVRTPAEYDPCEGILIAWEGTSTWLDILAQMARDVTTIGNAKVFVVTDTTTERSSASITIQARGADMSRVEFVVRTTDSIWIRDYGPRYIYLGVQPDGSGGVRAIVDHTYNRPRPNDNALPAFWASVRGEPRFALPLVHGGGNFHLESGDPVGVGHATRLIVNENPSLTESQIIGLWRDYQNLETTLYTPYPTSVDSTQHIDMWMIMLDDGKVMISEWVNEPSSSWNITSNNAAAAFAARGFAVYRVPAVRSGGTHYTFTNAVICNDLVLIPSYTNSTASPHNATALGIWQAALPGKTIRQIDSQAIVTSAGVLHCIVMHVPAPSGGQSPSVYLTSHNNGQALNPGTLQLVTWLTDDDQGATTADFYLSTNAGATYPTLLASGVPAGDESYYWTVPNVATGAAKIKIVVHDADGNTGFDETDLPFAINGTACLPDWNHDQTLDFFDVAAFLADFAALNPAADLTGEGLFDFFDVSTFLAAFSNGCP
ncbi:MAG: agmatine deiminase family protein [Phycisphaerales bacterium]|nr:agmatine deiminase family protein [Phycisphaerales bacterium]